MSVGITATGRRAAGPGRVQTVVVTAIVTLAIAGLSVYLSSSSDDGITQVNLAGATTGEAPAVGKAPIPFTGTAYDGSQVSLAGYAGKPLWLTFGASWCADCRVEAADLEATYQAYKGQGLNVLGVFINDPASDIAGFARRASLTFPIVADETSKIGSAYRLMGIPTHVFIGADGLIKEIRIGALSKDQMEQYVRSILQ